MAVGDNITRADAADLLAEQDINEILQDATKSSAALQAFRVMRMGAKVARMPVLTALPTAGFVDESATAAGGVKPVTEVTWGNLQITAEEIAVIVPIHENILDDSDYDIWAEVRPLVAQEFARILDGAVLFGTNKPASWPAGISVAARTAGNVFSERTRNIANGIDLAADINELWALVEADGHDITGQFATRSLRARLRGLRDSSGSPIYLSNYRGDAASDSIYGEPIRYVDNRSWVAAVDAAGGTGTGATMIAGDTSKAILGVRSDMQVKVLDQASLSWTGGTQLNLAERDMVALRFKMRIGFQVADPIMMQTGTRTYPFAVLAAPETIT